MSWVQYGIVFRKVVRESKVNASTQYRFCYLIISPIQESSCDFNLSYSSSVFCTNSRVMPLGQWPHMTPSCAISLQFNASASSNNTMSRYLTFVASRIFAMCTFFEPVWISMIGKNDPSDSSSDTCISSNKYRAQSPWLVRDAIATVISVVCCKIFKMAGTFGNSRISFSGVGRFRIWYSSGVHSVLSRSNTMTLGRSGGSFQSRVDDDNVWGEATGLFDHTFAPDWWFRRACRLLLWVTAKRLQYQP